MLLRFPLILFGVAGCVAKLARHPYLFITLPVSYFLLGESRVHSAAFNLPSSLVVKCTGARQSKLFALEPQYALVRCGP